MARRNRRAAETTTRTRKTRYGKITKDLETGQVFVRYAKKG